MAKKLQRKPKHIPMRTCVACREKVDKRRLTRVVRTPANDEGERSIVIDPTGKQNGRGAYLCDNPTCWERAVKKRVLDHALKTELSDGEREMLLLFISAETTRARQQPAVPATANNV